MDWKQTYYYNLQMWLFEPAEEGLSFLRDLLEWIHDGGKTWTFVELLTWGSDVIAKHSNVAKKLLVDDDKITVCVKQICLLDVICKVSNRKTLSGETFCCLEKGLLSILNFNVLQVTYCFIMNWWLAHNQLSWNVLWFSCNPVGQLCLIKDLSKLNFKIMIMQC